MAKKYLNTVIPNPPEKMTQVETLSNVQWIFNRLKSSSCLYSLTDGKNLDKLPNTIAASVFKEAFEEACALNVRQFPELRRLILEFSKTKTSNSDNHFTDIYLMIADARDGLEQNLANIDPLTGLLNRRAFEEIFPKVQKSIKENKRIAKLLFIDLDRFKQLNDTYGHDAGDQILLHVAQRLQAHTRKNVDYVVRMGGDEFVIILIDSNDHEKSVENVSAALDDPITFYSGGKTRLANIGFTVGVENIEATSSLKSIVKAADIKMLNIKNQKKALALVNQQEENCASLKPS